MRRRPRGLQPCLTGNRSCRRPCAYRWMALWTCHQEDLFTPRQRSRRHMPRRRTMLFRLRSRALRTGRRSTRKHGRLYRRSMYSRSTCICSRRLRLRCRWNVSRTARNRSRMRTHTKPTQCTPALTVRTAPQSATAFRQQAICRQLASIHRRNIAIASLYMQGLCQALARSCLLSRRLRPRCTRFSMVSTRRRAIDEVMGTTANWITRV